EQHLLGKWLADARSWGATGAEKDQLEYDARSIITTWGGRAQSDEGLHDYANREWSGLVGGLYLTRWRTYFDELSAALKKGKEPAVIDWFALEDAWAHRHDAYPVRAAGDVHRLAGLVRDTLAADPHQTTLAASSDRGSVSAGRPTTVTVTFTNRNGFAAATGVTLSVDPPDGMSAKPAGAVTATSVAPGESFSASFTVALTGAAAGKLVSRVPVTAAYRTGAAAGSALAAVWLLAGTGVEAPYRTASFNDAVFGESGDTLAVEGGGADLWGATNEFGAVYRAGAFGDSSVATVTVTSQDATGGWARAGLIVRNDLSDDGSAGYVNLAVTPSNGCALSWDADGDGRFDSIALSGAFTAPVRLRLTRSGGSYIGECSTDGINWTRVGTATPAGAADSQDAGVFMTAANGWTGTRGVATFEGFTVA
ncbi:alpha-N-acetylglucosaminidase C-terminal domain-containing protein, partial [Streptomyces sp. NPDC057927]